MKPKKELAIGALKQIWKNSQRGVARKFCIGDIVEDTKNNEYGIFLAVKPVILSKEKNDFWPQLMIFARLPQTSARVAALR